MKQILKILHDLSEEIKKLETDITANDELTYLRNLTQRQNKNIVYLENRIRELMSREVKEKWPANSHTPLFVCKGNPHSAENIANLHEWLLKELESKN